jgi:hypothetical protein
MLKQTLAFASLLTLFGCADEPGTSETAAFIASSTAPTLVYSTTRPSETETYPQLPRLQFRIRDSASVASLSGLYTNC